jgi:uncharacterized protein (UPF0147 family)
MGALDDIQELLGSLLQDTSISKNIRIILEEINEDIRDNKNIAININSALQKVEDLCIDPNLSQYVRTQIWSLTTLLENAQHEV